MLNNNTSLFQVLAQVWNVDYRCLGSATGNTVFFFFQRNYAETQVNILRQIWQISWE